MAIFKKTSPLEGNAVRGDGTAISFTGMYYETESESDIEFLSGFSCYVQVESKDESDAPAQEAPKAARGTVSAADLVKMAATNK